MKKQLIIFSTYFLSAILESCCGCPEIENPFFDYNFITLEHSEIVSSDTLVIELFPDSLEYLAATIKSSIFLNSAYACSCDEPGNIEKFEIEDVVITSNKAFSDTIPAYENLTEYFEVSTYRYSGTEAYVPLNQESTYRTFNFPFWNEGMRIRATLKPEDISESHRLTIEVVRSNGTSRIATTSPIQWE